MRSIVLLFTAIFFVSCGSDKKNESSSGKGGINLKSGSCLTADQLAGTWQRVNSENPQAASFTKEGQIQYFYNSNETGDTVSSGTFTIACPKLNIEINDGVFAGKKYTLTIGDGKLSDDEGGEWKK